MQIEVQKGCDERTQSSSRDRQCELAAVAGRQHGVVARRQLLVMGFSRDQVTRMRQARRLHNVHRGVYAVGHRILTDRARWMAAVLACGPDALLSHRSAAALRQIRRTSPAYVEVTVPSRRGRIDGVRAHVSHVRAQDRGTVDGIPCTSLPLPC